MPITHGHLELVAWMAQHAAIGADGGSVVFKRSNNEIRK